MLEDESGRIKLVGERLASTRLVTGVIIAVLGMETAAGDFEAVDICYPDLAPFAKTDALNDKNMDADGRLVARISRMLLILITPDPFYATNTWLLYQDFR